MNEVTEVKLQAAEVALADLKAKYEMLKSHCDDREHYIKLLEQTIVRMAIRRMEDSDI